MGSSSPLSFKGKDIKGMSGRVYLAGPISGLDYNGANNWREYVRQRLPSNVHGLNPMRGKSYLAKYGILQADCDQYDNVLSSNRGIMTRDRWDATRCDALLVNFLGAKQVSIGTCMEIAWADLYRIPIIVIMEPEGNPHEHAMIKEAIGYRVTSLDEAIQVLGAMFADG